MPNLDVPAAAHAGLPPPQALVPVARAVDEIFGDRDQSGRMRPPHTPPPRLPRTPPVEIQRQGFNSTQRLPELWSQGLVDLTESQQILYRRLCRVRISTQSGSKRNARPRFAYRPCVYTQTTVAGQRWHDNREPYFHWGGTSCCGNGALRDQWGHLCRGRAPPRFVGHPLQPRLSDPPRNLSIPPASGNSRDFPLEEPTGAALDEARRSAPPLDADPTACFWALNGFWAAWNFCFPPHAIDGGCTATLPEGTLRPRNEGKRFQRGGWDQPPLVSNRRFCQQGWRTVGTWCGPHVPEFIRYNLRPLEEGCAGLHLAGGIFATGQGHAVFSLCPACHLAYSLIAMGGEGALRFTPEELNRWIGLIGPEEAQWGPHHGAMLRLARDHSQVLDLSDDEGENEENSPYFGAKVASDVILPPPGYPRGGGGGDGGDQGQAAPTPVA